MDEKQDSVIQIVGLISGARSAFDGHLCRDGTEPGTGRPMLCHLVTTPCVEEATTDNHRLDNDRFDRPHRGELATEGQFEAVGYAPLTQEDYDFQTVNLPGVEAWACPVTEEGGC